MPVDPRLRNFVCDRAENRCEYCRLHQDHDPLFRFHIEHVVAKQHGGLTVESNLALSCHHCNLHKGPNLTGIDADTGAIVPLFNPRTQQWEHHFTMQGGRLVGLTPIGKTTIAVLAMNVPARIELRALAGRKP
jgi:hypothetical protein